MTFLSRDPETRFLEKIEKREDGCWIWTASLDHGGYGHFYHGRTKSAHRWAYTHWVGPIPSGLTIDHLCRVRHCVNPAHMEAVTKRENTLRGEGVAAVAARKTHCYRGHRFSEDNLLNTADGKRVCRECARERGRRARAARRLTNSEAIAATARSTAIASPTSKG